MEQYITTPHDMTEYKVWRCDRIHKGTAWFSTHDLLQNYTVIVQYDKLQYEVCALQ